MDIQGYQEEGEVGGETEMEELKVDDPTRSYPSECWHHRLKGTGRRWHNGDINHNLEKVTLHISNANSFLNRPFMVSN